MIIEQVQPDRKSLPTRGIKSNPYLWLEEKKTRDAQLWGAESSRYWIIQNKMYDLSSFIDQHPGGPKWLTMTQGQDVTDFFIIHHLNQAKARETLSQYYVGDTQKQVSRYSFEEGGLYRTIRKKVLQKYTPFQIQNEATTRKHAILILVMFLSCLSLTTWLLASQERTWWPYLTSAISAFLMLGIVGVGHNFVHHKDNYFKYYFLMAGFSHDEWQVMHCLSHHIYPNLELDYEAAVLEPIGFFLRTMPKNHIFTEPLVILVFTFYQPLNMIVKMVVSPILHKKMPDFLYLIPVFLVFGVYYLRTGDFWYSLQMHMVLYCIFGFTMNRMLFCGHRLQNLWSEGAPRIQDFGEHTMASTSDTDIWITGFWSLVLTGGFNQHTPHHLFPTADIAIFPKLLPIIDQVCKEKGVGHSVQSRISCQASISKGIVNRVPYQSK